MSTLVTLTPLLSVFAFVVAGAFSFVQWLDVRRREVMQRRWSDYTAQLSIAGGARPDGIKPTIFDQTAALYQLLEYPEHAFITVRALENVNPDDPQWKEWKDFSERHVKRVLYSLRSRKTYAQQAARFKYDEARST